MRCVGFPLIRWLHRCSSSFAHCRVNFTSAHVPQRYTASGIKRLFSDFDLDADGILGPGDLRAMIRTMRHRDAWTLEETQRLLLRFGDDPITEPEFETIMAAVFNIEQDIAPAMRSKNPRASRIETMNVITPKECHNNNRLRAGELLKWVDGAALACSWRHGQQNAVTGRVDHIFFQKPARIGDSIHLVAEVTHAWRNMMEIQVDAYAQDLICRDPKRHVMSCFAVFMALDFEIPDPRKYTGQLHFTRVDVPVLVPETEDDKKRMQEALLRKERRRAKLNEELQEEIDFESTAEPTSSLPGHPPSYSQIEMSIVVLPQHANPYQTCFGGQLMNWMTLCALSVSRRHSQREAITVAIDEVSFNQPVFVGELITLKGSITRAFRTTCEVLVELYAEDRWSAVRRLCCWSYMTIQSLNASALPCEIPPVLPETEVERRRYNNAAIRRHHRVHDRVPHTFLPPPQ